MSEFPSISDVDGVPALAQLFAVFDDIDKIGIAVSGGADSVALMLLVREWALPLHKQVFVYTVDHGLRAEAAAECAAVVDLAQQLGLTARLLRWEGDKPTSGIQAAAREARYELIANAMAQDGVPVLATGHHLEDQAETVLMRLAHGSGIGGLAGMSSDVQSHGIRICRPLLGVSKQVLVACVERAGVSFVADPSNENRKYERVRWRQALAQLAKEGLGAVRIADLANRARRADTALDFYMRQAFAEVGSVSPFGIICLERDGLRALPEEIAVRIMRHVVDWAGVSSRPYALAPLEALTALVRGTEVFGKRTMGGCVIQAQGANICVLRESSRIVEAARTLAPGDCVRWDGRFEISNVSQTASLSVTDGRFLSRKSLKEQLGQTFDDLIAGIRAAPVVYDASGGIIAVGCVARSPDVKVVLTIA